MSFKQFEIDITNVFAPLIVNFIKSDEGREAARALGKYVLEGEPVPYKKRTFSKVDIYKSELFSGFTEISRSFYTLRDIEVIIAAISTRQSRISKTRLLSYHIHNYLNENYILETRLIQYPARLFRSSKRWNKETKKMAGAMKEAITQGFMNLNTIRGSHVHSRRYTDEQLDRLSMLETFFTDSVPDLQEPFRKLFNIEFGICRRAWLDKIKKNNDDVENILDSYVEAIRIFIFDKNGNLIIPKTLNTA